MNIWDSVHRGLEKASHEAARIARVQRLRTTIDTLNRQVYTQQGTLLARTMEAFHEGRLIQSELLPLCQELATLQQQLEQAQNELKQPQNQGPMTASPSSAPTTPITAFVSDPLATTQPEPMYQMYADQAPPPPPPYQPYATPTIPVPPPPPSLEPVDLGSMETQAIERETPPPAPGQRLCLQCGSTAPASQLYCQNCGALLENREAAHLPTVRASNSEDPATGESKEKDGGH